MTLFDLEMAQEAMEAANRMATVHPLPTAKQQQDLELIRSAADKVVAEDINRSRPQYLHRLRELVEDDLSRPARDDLYRREIGEAIIRRDGIESKPFMGGSELPDDGDEWMVEGLIRDSQHHRRRPQGREDPVVGGTDRQPAPRLSAVHRPRYHQPPAHGHHRGPRPTGETLEAPAQGRRPGGGQHPRQADRAALGGPQSLGSDTGRHR